MEKNLLKTVIILLAVAFIGLQGCEKKGIDNTKSEDKELETPVYEFSKSITIADKNGISADITIYSDNESSLEQEIMIIPQYEKPIIENNEVEEDNADVEFNEKVQIYFDIENVKLPKGAIGFSISHNSFNKGSSYTSYGYDSSYDAFFITKTNSKGYIKWDVDVLYTGSQWFYSNFAKGKLKNKSSASSGTPGSFYKMRAKVYVSRRAQGNWYFYSF